MAKTDTPEHSAGLIGQDAGRAAYRRRHPEKATPDALAPGTVESGRAAYNRRHPRPKSD